MNRTHQAMLRINERGKNNDKS